MNVWFRTQLMKLFRGRVPLITLCQPGWAYAIKQAKKFSQVRECCFCGFRGEFYPYGLPLRLSAECPNCHSLERHRLLYLVNEKYSLIPRKGRLLHFAPEKVVEEWLRSLCHEYISCDIKPGVADKVLNIENIEVTSNSFDVVLCSHVLEHVDDKRAISEIHRILRPGGFAILMVPIIEGMSESYENSEYASDHERMIHFGQEDHVRRYGGDFRQRVKEGNFELKEYELDVETCVHNGLALGERVFVAIKP